jgi:hypothetical protein
MYNLKNVFTGTVAAKIMRTWNSALENISTDIFTYVYLHVILLPRSALYVTNGYITELLLDPPTQEHYNTE